jgi:hypothetical protein
MNCSRCGDCKSVLLVVEQPMSMTICINCIPDFMDELMRINNPVSISYVRLDSGERWALTCSLQGKATVAMLPQR